MCSQVQEMEVICELNLFPTKLATSRYDLSSRKKCGLFKKIIVTYINNELEFLFLFPSAEKGVVNYDE